MKAEVAVIGGGVVGLFVARRLAMRGVKVTLFEAESPGSGASGAAVGVLKAPAPARTAFGAISREGAEAYASLAPELFEETGIDTGYRPCGCIHLSRELPRDPQREVESWAWTGVKASWCERERIEELVPGYGGEQSIGLELDREALIDPPALLAALEASCRARGVEIIQETGRLELREKDGRALLPQSWASRMGEDTRVVVAAGSWTPAVVDSMGAGRVAVAPVRGQAIELEHPPPSCVVHFCLAGSDTAYYLVPKPGGRIWLGSTVEEVGYDDSLTAHGLAELLVAGRSVLPGLGEEAVRRQWAGLRPKALRLGGPFIGRWPGVGNLWVAAGNYRTGILQGPATARILCEAMEDGVEIDESFSLLEA